MAIWLNHRPNFKASQREENLNSKFNHTRQIPPSSTTSNCQKPLSYRKGPFIKGIFTIL
ncbi:hypothetical protein [Coxiella endosymbiont of Rhipicephalus microplus]|uniref:hypothetical protein n=1 Tax=Coxiella endosymbiont of Rhipicephalus microplus TaxID=1656186 RepID=UPI001F1A7CED|nr:hypothetical protein [Coxiella endosymbiont of Rhipicephalus microplus]